MLLIVEMLFSEESWRSFIISNLGGLYPTKFRPLLGVPQPFVGGTVLLQMEGMTESHSLWPQGKKNVCWYSIRVSLVVSSFLKTYYKEMYNWNENVFTKILFFSRVCLYTWSTEVVCLWGCGNVKYICTYMYKCIRDGVWIISVHKGAWDMAVLCSTLMAFLFPWNTKQASQVSGMMKL